MEQLKKNIKTVLKVWAVLILVILIALFGMFLFYSPTLVSIPYWYHFKNKMIIISASIEAYKQENGKLPVDLKEVEPILFGYLKFNPTIKEKYLAMPWTTKKGYPFFEGTKYGYKIQYLTDKSNYYLYFPMSKIDKTYFTQQELEDMLSHNVTLRGSLIIIKNGKWVRSPWSENQETFTFQNMEKYLKDLSGYRSSYPTKVLYRINEILWDLFH